MDLTMNNVIPQFTVPEQYDISIKFPHPFWLNILISLILFCNLPGVSKRFIRKDLFLESGRTNVTGDALILTPLCNQRIESSMYMACGKLKCIMFFLTSSNFMMHRKKLPLALWRVCLCNESETREITQKHKKSK